MPDRDSDALLLGALAVYLMSYKTMQVYFQMFYNDVNGKN